MVEGGLVSVNERLGQLIDADKLEAVFRVSTAQHGRLLSDSGQLRDLPVRVHQRYDNWRRIEGPGGAEGWMAVALLSERRTGMVTGEQFMDLHEQPDSNSPVLYQVEPGAVGRISECDGQWCRISFVVGRKQRGGGWIVQGALWGVDEGEVIDD